MKKNITKITITKISSEYLFKGTLLEAYAYNTLMLRTARKVGDQENVNNYVLGKLREAKSYGAIDFTETK